MAFIPREDGEHFVIPSYRDILSAKKESLLKKEITLLSESYGQYITMQKRAGDQYEVAFSPDAGYLLGETVWHHFRRPADLIYCETLPNTNEAILVIVKGGSVYLDGRFPLDSITDELIIFRTQQNYFEVFVYGDVPISKNPTEDKFSFPESSVKSYTVLPEPAFPRLPLVKAFQLKLVDTVLREQRIGAFPTSFLVGTIILLGLAWMAWSFLTSAKKEIPIVYSVTPPNPYQPYLNALTSPDPSVEVADVLDALHVLYTVPGWIPVTVKYAKNNAEAAMKSLGARTDILMKWATQKNMQLRVRRDGFYLVWKMDHYNRYSPGNIHKMTEVIGALSDRLSYILPGNNIEISDFNDKKAYIDTKVKINFVNITPSTLDLIGKQLKNLPLVLNGMTIQTVNGNVSGNIDLQALGN